MQYSLREELEYPATMDFYPEFAQDRIIEMPVRFIYNGWAPWNKELSSDMLQTDVLKWYEKVYGTGFIEIDHSRWGTAYTKIDGNRRITIFKEDDDMHVWAVFTDMLAESEVSDSTSESGIIHDEINKELEK